MKDYSVRKRILVTGGAGFLGSHLWVGLKPTIAYFEQLLNEGFGKGRAVA